MGMVNETFETAITWDRFDALYGDVMDAVRGALVAIGSQGRRHLPFHARVSRRTGAVLHRHRARAARRAARAVGGRQGRGVRRARAPRRHDHAPPAVGRDHRRWYDQQRPHLFAEALRSVKATLDPHATLNPGVLIDP